MEELSLFDFPQVEINKPIRLIELFGGIGSQAMALRDIGANFEHYRLVEFDKYAVASYNAIHGTNFTTTDIRDVHGVDMGIVNRQEFTYLLTYSFPCFAGDMLILTKDGLKQIEDVYDIETESAHSFTANGVIVHNCTDLSVAGKMQGMSKLDWENGKSTRSGLLWEVERILKELKDDELPQILLMENVPQVHSEQNIADFESWLNFLRSRGYYNFYQDLNAKDYGIPQNRERCFCVSILSDEFVDFDFPKPVKLDTVMRDYLEDQVNEKYYIKSEKADKLIVELQERQLLERERNPNDKIYLGNYYGRHDGYDGSVFHPNGICKTITHSKGGVADIIDVAAINAEKDGSCRTIKAQYAKNSVANFIRTDSLGAAGVIECQKC